MCPDFEARRKNNPRIKSIFTFQQQKCKNNIFIEYFKRNEAYKNMHLKSMAQNEIKNGKYKEKRIMNWKSTFFRCAHPPRLHGNART